MAQTDQHVAGPIGTQARGEVGRLQVRPPTPTRGPAARLIGCGATLYGRADGLAECWAT